MSANIKIAIAGGGTGGHVFPALNIADVLKKDLNAKVLFFGTERGLENKKVPQYGYDLIKIPVAGFQRKWTLKNVSFPWKLFKSMQMSKRSLQAFNPDLVIGTGGYVMGPVLKSAQKLGITTVLQEQNSYPGVTTRLLAKKADVIFLAYEEAREYLQTQARVLVTGNPISLIKPQVPKSDLFGQFNLDEQKKLLLVFGGSQGSEHINQALVQFLTEKGLPPGWQILWQTGHSQNAVINEFIRSRDLENIKVLPFIDSMERAYAISKLVLSRAGAMTLSELMASGLPAILVPYPYAAADHQYKNARALEKSGAAIVIRDDAHLNNNIKKSLLPLLEDEQKQNKMAKKMAELHTPDAIGHILKEIRKLLAEKKR